MAPTPLPETTSRCQSAWLDSRRCFLPLADDGNLVGTLAIHGRIPLLARADAHDGISLFLEHERIDQGQPELAGLNGDFLIRHISIKSGNPLLGVASRDGEHPARVAFYRLNGDQGQVEGA